MTCTSTGAEAELLGTLPCCHSGKGLSDLSAAVGHSVMRGCADFELCMNVTGLWFQSRDRQQAFASHMVPSGP